MSRFTEHLRATFSQTNTLLHTIYDQSLIWWPEYDWCLTLCRLPSVFSWRFSPHMWKIPLAGMGYIYLELVSSSLVSCVSCCSGLIFDIRFCKGHGFVCGYQMCGLAKRQKIFFGCFTSISNRYLPHQISQFFDTTVNIFTLFVSF